MNQLFGLQHRSRVGSAVHLIINSFLKKTNAILQ